MVAVNLLFQIRDNRALLHITIALRRAVDHLPQRAETSGARQGSRLWAERNGGCGAGGEELDDNSLVTFTMAIFSKIDKTYR